jgi:hypothetical protein
MLSARVVFCVLAHDRVLMIMVINFWASWKAWSFLIIWVTISFSRTLIHEIILDCVVSWVYIMAIFSTRTCTKIKICGISLPSNHNALSLRRPITVLIPALLNKECVGLSCRSQWIGCSSLPAEVRNSDLCTGKETCGGRCCCYWGDCTRFQVLTSFICAQSLTTTYLLWSATKGVHTSHVYDSFYRGYILKLLPADSILSVSFHLLQLDSTTR